MCFPLFTCFYVQLVRSVQGQVGTSTPNVLNRKINKLPTKYKLVNKPIGLTSDQKIHQIKHNLSQLWKTR